MSGCARPRRFRGAVFTVLGLALTVGLLPAKAPEAVAGPATPAASGAGKAGGAGVAQKRSASASASAPHGPATATSESDALDQARRTGADVEVTSLRTETSEVFATPGGELEAREHVRPVRVRADGGWKPVDASLRRAADGAVVPGGTSVGLEFSGGGTAPMARLRRAGRELALSWPTPLPAPRLDGDFAVYPEVLPGVDLRLTAEVDGFAQLLVVKSAAAAASEQLAELRLRVAAQGVTVQEAPDGTLAAVDDGAGNAVFEALRPVMWDSSGTMAPAGTAGARTAGGSDSEPAASADNKPTPSAGSMPAATRAGDADVPAPGSAGGGRPAPVGVEVGAGGGELVLTPDETLLTGEDTVYPVYIDPQWYSPRASSWTVASRYWAGTPQWKFNGDPDAGLGYCGWAYCKPEDTKRLF